MRPLGYQLYSSRKFTPLIDTLRMLSDAGIEHVEPYAELLNNLLDLGELGEALQKYGLSMPAAHFNLSDMVSRPQWVLDVCRDLEIGTIVIPTIDPAQRPESGPDWLMIGRDIAEAAKPFRDAGLHVAYHNHDFEFEKLQSGKRPIDLLLQADPDLMLELDVAWAYKAGQDPLTCIETYADRILSAHIKDVAKPGTLRHEAGWADIGHGVMNWNKLWSALNVINVQKRFLEHGDPADHWRFAGRSLAAIRRFEMDYWL